MPRFSNETGQRRFSALPQNLLARLSAGGFDAVGRRPEIGLAASPGAGAREGGRSPDLCAAPDEWPACAVMHKLTTSILNVAVPRAERSTGRRYSSPGHTSDDGPDGPSDYGARNDTGRGACSLLGSLARCRSEADYAGKDELTHGDLPSGAQAPAES